MGPQKKSQQLTVFAFGKYWALLPKNGNRCVRTCHIGPQKPFLKKVFAELFP